MRVSASECDRVCQCESVCARVSVCQGERVCVRVRESVCVWRISGRKRDPPVVDRGTPETDPASPRLTESDRGGASGRFLGGRNKRSLAPCRRSTREDRVRNQLKWVSW